MEDNNSNSKKTGSRSRRFELWKCRICGSEYDLTMYDPRYPETQVMAADNVCHECAYWQTAPVWKDSDTEIIDGRVFKVKGSYRRKIFGTGTLRTQSPFAIYAKGERLIYKANTIWLQERIPERFRDMHPDTAMFVKVNSRAAEKVNLGYRCPRKGCFDRYSCALYDAKSETEPWNEVPKTHTPGSEKCPIFVPATEKCSRAIMERLFAETDWLDDGEEGCE